MRNLELNAPFLRTARGCYMYAVAKIAEQNAMASTATLTIMGRSEMRLGRPVYIRSHDVFGYVSGITHSFSFGGTFQTTLSLTAIRTKYHLTDPETQLDGKSPGGRQSFNVLGTGKVEGAPSRVMVFRSENILVDPEIVNITQKNPVPDLRPDQENERSGLSAAVAKQQFNEANNPAFSGFERDALLEDETLREAYGTAQGFWVEGKIPGVFTATERFIPVSDEFGYRHIGGFPYGRGMTIGSLDSIKPFSPEGEKAREAASALAAVDLEKRPPTVIEQYGLSSGKSLDELPVTASARTADDTNEQILDDADAATVDEIKSLKDNETTDFREIVANQQRKNSVSSCGCTGDTYVGSLIAKVTAENRGGPSQARAAGQADNARSQQLPPLPPSRRTAPPPTMSPSGDVERAAVITPGPGSPGPSG